MTIDDGWNNISEGATAAEAATWLTRFGAHSGLNLGGGTATTLVVADPLGEVEVVNRPNTPGLVQQPNGNHLGIRAEPLPLWIFADFEAGDEATFDRAPAHSGSTAGILASSEAFITSQQRFDGNSSQRLDLIDDPNATAVAANPSGGWFVRHVSGSAATRTQNVPRPTDGFVGFWAMTTDPDIRVTIAIDNTDNVTADRGVVKDLIADGRWHPYEWNLDDDAEWTSWFNGNGMIDTADFTIDSIQLLGPDSDVMVFLDRVSHNRLGSLVQASEWVTTDAEANWDESSAWSLLTSPEIDWSATVDNTTLASGQVARVTSGSALYQLAVVGTAGLATVQIADGVTLRVANLAEVETDGALAGPGMLDGSAEVRGAVAIATTSAPLHVTGSVDLDAAAILRVTDDYQQAAETNSGLVDILVADQGVFGAFATPAADLDASHLGRGHFLDAIEQTATVVRADIYAAEPGDANGDRQVTAAIDGAILLSSLLPSADRKQWTDGDFDNDGAVTASSDGATLLAGLATDSVPGAPHRSTTAIPEPGCLALFAWGLGCWGWVSLRARQAAD